MPEKMEETDKYITIAGFRNVKIDNVNEFFKIVQKKLENIEVQFFDAKLVASKDHIYFAALNALTAFENRLNRSKRLAIEVLLYASAQRQIKNAVDMIGINPNSTEVAVLIITKTKQQAETALEKVSELISGLRDDAVLELTDRKFAGIKKLFEISEMELEAKSTRKGFKKEELIDLVIEHVALLATER